MEKFLNWNDHKVQSISLEQLEASAKEDSVLNDPLKGIYHFQLLQQVISMIKEAGFNPEVYDLFAAHNRDKDKPGVSIAPYIARQVGEDAVEAHFLRRVYANIRLTDFDDETYTTNFAVAFHQRGIQVGFGNNVKICHNQCMLSPTQYAATYGDRGHRGEGMELPKLLEQVQDWLANAKDTIYAEREAIERMKAMPVGAERLFTIIGMLNAKRVQVDSTHKELRSNEVYPLNQTQLNKWTENLLLRKVRMGGDLTVWDLYDGATDLYKAESMDMPAILPQNRAMMNFLSDEFMLR